jgi:hypothetical protein
MSVDNYSSTPASNTAISGINLAEGCNASGINDAIRQLMADVAVFSTRPTRQVFTAGSGTYTPTSANVRYIRVRMLGGGRCGRHR